MRLNLQVTFKDGKSKEIIADFADIVPFETKFNVAFSKIGEDQRVTYLMWLAWHSEFRHKATTLDFDKWLETIDGFGDGESDPKSEG